MLNKHQHGQSTIEFIVLSLVLVPLTLIVPLLGKYIDIAHTTSIASRYVAFEGTVHHASSQNGWKSDATLASEVRRRFYSKHQLSIKTQDVVSETDDDRNALWTDHRGNHLLPDFNQITISTTTQNTPTIFNALNSAFDLSDNFGLNTDNLYRGDVSVRLANIESLQPFDNINLNIRRHTVLLVDPWASKSAGEVESKVKSAGLIFPYQLLDTTAKVLEIPINLFEFNASAPEIGKVEPDHVPADRLRPYR
ncbi:MAG: hypothetical protein Q8R74_11010 [Methylophilus sp.]|nr:hypothetical protein [Methylophilus sp.]